MADIDRAVETLRELIAALREAPVIEDQQGPYVCLLVSLRDRRINAIDAVLAERERLTRERDEARVKSLACERHCAALEAELIEVRRG